MIRSAAILLTLVALPASSASAQATSGSFRWTGNDRADQVNVSQLSSLENASLFDATVVLLNKTAAPFQRLLDIDGDGLMDIVGVGFGGAQGTMRVSWHLNHGSGGFSNVSQFIPNASFDESKSIVEVGDLDGNGMQDFVLASDALVFEFTSAGQGFNYTSWTAPGKVKAVALVDIDGDGSDELCHARATFLVLRLSSGVQHLIAHGLTNPNTIRAMHADDDGYLDFLVSANGSFRIFYHTPTGFTAGPQFSPMIGRFTLDVGDIDGDGDLDATVFSASGLYRVLRRADPSTLTLEAVQTGGPAEFLYDVDADGDLDGVCCGSGAGSPSYPTHTQRSDFQIALNDGAGAFASSFNIEGLGAQQLAGVADMDGDGDVDLVAGRSIYFADGQVRPLPSIEPGVDYPSRAPEPREICDVNGDGAPDILISLDELYLNVNDGTGTFVRVAVPIEGPRGFAYSGVLPGDFDGDGDVDILSELKRRPIKGSFTRVGRSALQVGYGMRFLANDGTGTFRDRGPAAVTGETMVSAEVIPEASIVGDLDGDGDLDLATRTMVAPHSSTLWFNDGDGFFIRGLWIAERVQAITDLNYDGNADVITAQLYGSVVPTLVPGAMIGIPGSPLPAFVNFAPFGVGGEQFLNLVYFPDAFALGDFDGDGYQDMAKGGVNPQVLLNTLSFVMTYGRLVKARNLYTTFGKPVPCGTGTYCRVLVADLDGDGLDDIVDGLIEGGPQITAIIKNQTDTTLNGSLTLEAEVLQIFKAGALADIDGDGDIDVLGNTPVFNTTY